MQPTDDSALLRQYAGTGSEEAFAALVSRHVNLVYSVALRSVGNPHHAEEITQAVFVILAKKAPHLRHEKALSSWLFQAARFTASNFIRSEMRRHHREQEAYMQSVLNESGGDTWQRIGPLLDSAVESLGDKDRRAIVLRFYEGRGLREVGAALGASEDAAEKRVTRAVEKLRRAFYKRGVIVPAAVLAAAISAHSVQAAPATLATTATAIAAAQGATASGSTLTLIKGALKLMAWTKAKTAIIASVGILLAAGTTTVVVHKIVYPGLSARDLSWANNPRYWRLDSSVLEKNPPVLILRKTRFHNRGGNMQVGQSFGRGTMMLYEDASLPSLISLAYSVNEVHLVLPDGLPQEHFDFMFTQSGSGPELLQNELKRQLGITAHYETRDTDIFYLTQSGSNAPGLNLTKGGNQYWMGESRGNFSIESITNTSFQNTIGFFEGCLSRPIVDRTGLTKKYDVHLKWPDTGGVTAFQDAIHEQLGLETTPGREPVQMLVVEKAR